MIRESMTPLNDLGAVLAAAGYVRVEARRGLVIDIRYATPDNFLGHAVYGSFDRLYLHPIAAAKLDGAMAHLEKARPDLSFRVFDGLRPNRIQRQMWATVAGTPQQAYVGDPAIGSIHGFGLAIDLTLTDAAGRDLDMGTPFDDFTTKSEPQREVELLAAGTLTEAQVAHRRLLRTVMTDAEFLPIALEWWHFDALPPAEVRANFVLVE